MALACIRVAESGPEPASRGSFRRDFTAGFRHIRAVPLLAQITGVTACAFSVIGLFETIVFAVISQGLHRPAWSVLSHMPQRLGPVCIVVDLVLGCVPAPLR